MDLLRFIPKGKLNYFVVGFVIIAIVSTWLDLKKAAIVDAQGDISSLELKIAKEQKILSNLQDQYNNPNTDVKQKEKIDINIKKVTAKITKFNDKKSDERLDVLRAEVKQQNGIWFWTLVLKIGSAILGLGLIQMFTRDEENGYVRMAALIVLGYLIAQSFIG